jgi:hypothetical protein
MISYNTVNFFGILERSIEKAVESTHSKIEYIKFSEIFFIGTRSLQIESCIIFRDDDHFSECGENLIAPFMKNSLIKLGF